MPPLSACRLLLNAYLTSVSAYGHFLSAGLAPNTDFSDKTRFDFPKQNWLVAPFLATGAVNTLIHSAKLAISFDICKFLSNFVPKI